MAQVPEKHPVHQIAATQVERSEKKEKGKKTLTDKTTQENKPLTLNPGRATELGAVSSVNISLILSDVSANSSQLYINKGIYGTQYISADTLQKFHRSF